MFKPSFMTLFLAAAVALPYALSSSSGLRDMVFKIVPSGESKTEATPAAPQHANDAFASIAPMTPVSREPIEIYDLPMVLRFDVTKPWIMDHWARVSTSLSELDLQGYRVALVTGTTPSDLAGSLTYFFNPEQKLVRIEFHGMTGDAQKLMGYLVGTFGLEREQTSDPALVLYNVKEYGQTVSEVRVKPMRVIRRDSPNSRYEVSLVLRKG